MPTLVQIQDYVRNLRRKLGNCNNIEDVGNVGDIDPVVATALAIAPVVDTNLAIDKVGPELVAHDASDITEEFLESVEDKTNTYYSNPPHRQAAIPKCLAITPPITRNLCLLISLRITKYQQLFTTKIGVYINDFTLIYHEKNVADFRGFNSKIPLSF